MLLATILLTLLAALMFFIETCGPAETSKSSSATPVVLGGLAEPLALRAAG